MPIPNLRGIPTISKRQDIQNGADITETEKFIRLFLCGTAATVKDVSKYSKIPVHVKYRLCNFFQYLVFVQGDLAEVQGQLHYHGRGKIVKENGLEWFIPESSIRINFMAKELGRCEIVKFGSSIRTD